MDPLAAPPAPPMPPMPEAPAADPLMDPLAAPPAPPAPEAPAADPLAALSLDPPADAPADTVVADLTGEQAGATIRSRAEVEAVPGDKLEGTLHEVETTTLNADGNIIKQNVKGTLTVNNPSAEDRIYDIDVLLDNIDATDIGGEHVLLTSSSPQRTTRWPTRSTASK